MPGGLIQLQSYGIQNIRLTGNPQITFFKSVYKRHTNFAIEAVKLQFIGKLDFGKRNSLIIERKADLLSRLYLHFKLPSLTATSGTYAGWTNAIGYAIIEYIELEIGGNILDKHYGVWMEIWDELTVTENKRAGVNEMVGKFESLAELETNATGETVYYVPLQFWFCRNIGLSLPLIALNYHEIRVTIKLRNFSECVVYDGATPPSEVNITSISILADYIYIDNDERKRFAEKHHSYLITQLQYNEKETIKAGVQDHNVCINFNHPVEEIQWGFVETDSQNNNDWFNFSQNGVVAAQMSKATITLDGTERFETRDEEYFRLIQPYQHHTTITDKFIYVYSFAFDPEKHQPSGSLNFSKVGEVVLQFSMVPSLSETNLYIYGRNSNIFVVKSGLGGIAFAN